MRDQIEPSPTPVRYFFSPWLHALIWILIFLGIVFVISSLFLFVLNFDNSQSYDSLHVLIFLFVSATSTVILLFLRRSGLFITNDVVNWLRDHDATDIQAHRKLIAAKLNSCKFESEVDNPFRDYRPFPVWSYERDTEGQPVYKKDGRFHTGYMHSKARVGFAYSVNSSEGEFDAEIICDGGQLLVKKGLPAHIASRLEHISLPCRKDFPMTLTQSGDLLRLEFLSGSWLGIEYQRRLDSAYQILSKLID